MITVSIGLPVYNGEKYIGEAINSFLEQSFSDFELIICDNASSDATAEICTSFAKKDKRIKYFRNLENIGAGPNFNRTFLLSSGRFFKWASHDDFCHPHYLESCLEVLEKDPSVVLCHSEVQRVDQNGSPISDYAGKLLGADSQSVARRFRAISSLYHSCLDIFGVIRREALQSTSLIRPYVGSDRTLLVELGLIGRFYRVPERLFFSRDHPGRSIRACEFRKRSFWWDPKRAVRSRLPWWRYFGDLLVILGRSKLSLWQKAACASTLLIWIKESRAFLYEDIQKELLGRKVRSKRNPVLNDRA